MTKPTYLLTLGKTYYDKGYFNLGIEIEKFVSKQDCQINLVLGSENNRLVARLTRTANINETPRVFGGIKLRNWFWQHFQLNDEVEIVIISPRELWIKLP